MTGNFHGLISGSLPTGKRNLCSMRALLILQFILIPYSRFSQTSVNSAKPAFEAVSVKPNLSGNPTSAAFINGRFVATNSPLKLLIEFAYLSVSRRFVLDRQISGGADWIDKDGFDIVATTSD